MSCKSLNNVHQRSSAAAGSVLVFVGGGGRAMPVVRTFWRAAQRHIAIANAAAKIGRKPYRVIVKSVSGTLHVIVRDLATYCAQRFVG